MHIERGGSSWGGVAVGYWEFKSLMTWNNYRIWLSWSWCYKPSYQNIAWWGWAESLLMLQDLLRQPFCATSWMDGRDVRMRFLFCSRHYYSLQDFLSGALSGAANPDGARAGQQALYCSSTESDEDRRGKVCSPHQAQKVQMLLSLFNQWWCV